jgi:RNA polymerase sigma factor (sigma-70 family)
MEKAHKEIRRDMHDTDPSLSQFEAERERLRGIAYRMLGSASEADDALQEAWMRLQSNERDRIENIGGWLTTVVSRIALDMLRTRQHRREQVLDASAVDKHVDLQLGGNPERELLLAESIGIGLLVVLERLQPAERLAFVLHDLFGVSFDDIASIVGRSPAASRQLASRARRRVQGVDDNEAVRSNQQHRIVSAFFAASRKGDFTGLLKLLDPDIELTVDGALLGQATPLLVRGAENVAKRAKLGAAQALASTIMLVDGEAGIVVAPAGRLRLVMIFELSGDRISKIEIVADQGRLRNLKLSL